MSNRIGRGERRKLRMALGTRTNRRRGTKSKVIQHVSPGKPCPKARFPLHPDDLEKLPKVKLRGLISRYKAGLIWSDGTKRGVEQP